MNFFQFFEQYVESQISMIKIFLISDNSISLHYFIYLSIILNQCNPNRKKRRHTKYLTCLDYETRLKKLGRSLVEVDEGGYSFFLKYRIEIFESIQWTNKSEYISLLTEFVEEEISEEQYFKKLYSIQKKFHRDLVELEMNLDRISRFKLDAAPRKFYRLIEQLYRDYRNFNNLKLTLPEKKASFKLKKDAKFILLQLKRF